MSHNWVTQACKMGFLCCSRGGTNKGLDLESPEPQLRSNTAGEQHPHVANPWVAAQVPTSPDEPMPSRPLQLALVSPGHTHRSEVSAGKSPMLRTRNQSRFCMPFTTGFQGAGPTSPLTSSCCQHHARGLVVSAEVLGQVSTSQLPERHTEVYTSSKV